MENNSKISLVTFLLLILIIGLIIPFVYSQPDDKHLPVLLIHGYVNDASVWDEWLIKLKKDGITNVEAVEFSKNDKCGSAEDHAEELTSIVEKFKAKTKAEKINIVAYSKGGLDARVYLANDLSNKDIANLIMIGTPNDGTELATYTGFTAFFHPLCIESSLSSSSSVMNPAIFDMKPGAFSITEVPKNENTEYYAIAGNWIPDVSSSSSSPSFSSPSFSDINCPFDPIHGPFPNWKDFVSGNDDGMVSVDSVVSGGSFELLGEPTNNCHTNLFSDEEYDLALPILQK